MKSANKSNKSLKSTLSFLPHITGIPLTIYLVDYCLKTNYLIHLFKLSLPREIQFENKISFLAKIGTWIAFVLLFNVLSVIISRVYSGASNPLKDDGNKIVNLANKILRNSVEQGLIFFPLLSNWVLNMSTTNTDMEHALTLTIIWILGRLIFSITYLFGYLLDFSLLRVYGFSPTLIPSIVLILRYLGIRII